MRIFIVALIAAVLGSILSLSARAEEAPIDIWGLKQGSCEPRQFQTERGCLIPPELKKRILPSFPDEALAVRAQGRVFLKATVEVNGKVSSTKVIECTKPGVGFEEAAGKAVKKWKYKPARIGDEAIRVDYMVIVDFYTQK